MINTKTNNKSFIKMWRHLQDCNVENNSFMLDLKDESLKNFKLEDLFIDDKDERNELIDRVINECKNNIWFFFREIVQIGNPIGLYSGLTDETNVSFILNPINCAMIYLYDKKKSFYFNSSYFHNGKNNIFRKYGVTTTLLILSLYEFFISNNHIHLRSNRKVGELKYLINMIKTANFRMFPDATDNDYPFIYTIDKDTFMGEKVEFLIEGDGDFKSFLNVINKIHYGSLIFSIGESSVPFDSFNNDNGDSFVHQMSTILYETYVSQIATLEDIYDNKNDIIKYNKLYVY